MRDGSVEALLAGGSVRATWRFEYAIRHCPKCGWQGPSDEHLLRYCGPGQRVETHWWGGGFFVLGPDDEEDTCGLPGEHVHWCCGRCRYRRVLPVPDPGRSGLS